MAMVVASNALNLPGADAACRDIARPTDRHVQTSYALES